MGGVEEGRGGGTFGYSVLCHREGGGRARVAAREGKWYSFSGQFCLLSVAQSFQIKRNLVRESSNPT